jgi:hypothetical protein
MKDQKFLVEINGCKIVGTLDQCTKLLSLLGEMQTAGEEYGDGYIYYPTETDLEMKALVGRNRWAESKEVAKAVKRTEAPALVPELAEAF